MLAWSLLQDMDASLGTVAQVIRDTADARQGGSAAEALLRELLGPEVYDKFFQFRDREGQPEDRSGFLRGRSLPLSALARDNARRGVRTLETLMLRGGERVRLLTLPIVRETENPPNDDVKRMVAAAQSEAAKPAKVGV